MLGKNPIKGNSSGVANDADDKYFEIEGGGRQNPHHQHENAHYENLREMANHSPIPYNAYGGSQGGQVGKESMNPLDSSGFSMNTTNECGSSSGLGDRQGGGIPMKN